MHLKISGKECVKILCNDFGFYIVRRKGSHVVLRKGNLGTVVPMHKELKKGTLRGLLKLAGLSVDEFEKHI